MEANTVADLQNGVVRNPEVRAGAVIGGIAERHDGIEPVVAARQFEDDEDPFGMLLDARSLERLRGQRSRRPAQERRERGADPDAVQPRARKSRRE